MSSDAPSARLKELAAAAILGADRAGVGAAAMLRTAAAAGLRARAGWRGSVEAEGGVECPVDAAPAASRAAAATLDRLLTNPDEGLLVEWCTLAEARGQRVPAHAAPALLDWWSRQPQKPEPVFRALGRRGEWLAALNPAWRKPAAISEVPADVDARWQTGTGAERAALLALVRRADPERALTLVRSTWSADGADERTKFVEALGQPPRPQDEPFLEACLDDRSKQVRREAARILTDMPGSGLRARMNERARACLKVEAVRKGLLRRQSTTVELVPPKDFDKAWERDGVEEQAAGGKGKRAWWMTQILSAADLDVWTAATGLQPPEVLAALEKDDYYGQAVEALMASAARAGAPIEWARTIMLVAAQRKDASVGGLVSLWTSRSLEESESMRLAAAGMERFRYGERWSLLTSDDRRWSRPFSARALAVAGEGQRGKERDWEYWNVFEGPSRLIDPSLADQFENHVLSVYPKDPPDSARKAVDRVRLRADMHREFQP